ncbi:MAG: undecaprenyl-diphosphate phosphatase [Clostridia bacterium]|nr:undecaprenyl-diphosphate phosphatase [Clostridia bacterium]
MTIFQAIILGIVQGLTELLPISSSAHLNIIPWVLGWIKQEEFRIAFEGFDVALHFGTLLAIAIFFFKDWINLIKGGYKQVVKKEKTTEGKMFWYIVIATIPGGAIGFLLDHFLEDALTKPIIIGIALLVMGIVLYIVDKNAKSNTDYEHMSFKQTFLIGLSQALAFIPGVSRSGVTMTTGRMMGIDREATAKYSFLLSTPIVFAATIYKLKDFVFSIPFFIGIVISFLVGIFVIKFLLEYLKKGSFKGFAIYRVIVGIVIIVLSFTI